MDKHWPGGMQAEMLQTEGADVQTSWGRKELGLPKAERSQGWNTASGRKDISSDGFSCKQQKSFLKFTGTVDTFIIPLKKEAINYMSLNHVLTDSLLPSAILM